MTLEDITHETITTLYEDGRPVEWQATIEPDMEKIYELIEKKLVTMDEVRELLGMGTIGKPIHPDGVGYESIWTCHYCGSLQYGSRCISCGAPRKG